MDWRGRNKCVDAATGGKFDRLASPGDIGRDSTGQPGDDRIFRPFGDGGDRFEIPLRGDGETRLDNIDTHLVQQLGDIEFVLDRHGGAGGLFAITQCGVKYGDRLGGGFLVFGLCRFAHRSWSFEPYATAVSSGGGI